VQVIKQDSGKLAVHDPRSGQIVLWDALPDEVVEFFIAVEMMRVEEMRERVRQHVAHVMADQPRTVYHQFAMSWEEALREDRRHDGEAHCAFPALPPDPCPDCEGEVDYRQDGSAKCRTDGCDFELVART
jgi:hypothetical protein